MKLVLLSANDDDRKTIETHMFARQFGIMIKDNCGYLYINVDKPEDIQFLAAILKCDFMFTFNGFQLNGKRYSTLKIIREEDECEHKNSGDRVLSQE